MARSFLTMKENVADDIQDESAAMKTRIGRYLNWRYMQVFRTINWDVITDDYEISVTAGTQDYTLPSNFKSEVYVLDKDNELELSRVSLQQLTRFYSDSLTDTGDVKRYAVWENDSGDKTLRLHPIPDSDITVACPYIVKPAEMSADTDTPLLVGVEDLLECGARADAHQYKRRYGASQKEELIFGQKLSNYIWEHENQKNQIHRFIPDTYDRDNLY